MYLEYFSLKRHPFRITPDPSLFFPGGTHGRGVVLDALVYGITTGEGILKVVGEVGSGKTMLCRMLEERLPPSIEIVYLANPNLTARDIVYAIAFELKLEVDSGTDRLLVMQKLQGYLLKKHSEGGSVVVFVEEAQGMPLETLEEIRLLSNLETHRHKLMQIVLFGQPELEHKLQSKSIRQLRERITHSFDLDPLTPEDVREYLHFRLQQAGCPWRLFSPRAEKMLASASGGLTRRINILADKSLLAAYADPSMRQEPRNSAGEILPMVLPRHVKTAIDDSGYRRFRLPQLPLWFVYGSTTAAVLVLVSVFVLQGGWLNKRSEAMPVAAAADTAAQTAREVAPAIEPPAPTVVAATASTSSAMSMPASNSPVTTPMPAVTVETNALAISESKPLGVTEQAPVSSVASVPAAQNPPVESTTPAATTNVPAKLQDVQHTSVTSRAPAEIAPPLAVDVSATQTAAPSAVALAMDEAEVVGLAGQRKSPSAAWVAALPSKQGYTIQLYSVSTQQPEKLEEFLEFLELTNLLERSYICVISANSRRPEQWLVMHDEFAGVSEARRFIDSLPAYLGQYEPYIRNLNDIACSE
jgi:type II secretory pathway predicted ATPase ExeA